MTMIDGIKKAAILMISLGSETSSKIMKLLPESYIQKVSYEIANTEVVQPEERNEVLDEFVNTATAREYVLDGGIDYAKNLLNQALGPQKAKEVIDVLNQIQLKERPFNIARQADTQQLANVLAEEQPQVIALVMCYLQPDKAAVILSQFPTELQTDVAERIGTISSTSPTVIKQVEKVIETKFSNSVSNNTENIGGVTTLVNILNAASRSTEKNIISDLEKRQPELSSEIKNSLFTFEDIVSLSNLDVQKVLRDIENDDIVLALKGTTDDIKNFIFENLSSRAADNIREEIEFMGPTRLANVEEAQQKIVAVIRKLDDAGEIYIERGDSDAIIK
ncbi:flagellar motor switch protein FliG [Periweissella beninensis]|uniref:Flagellar motor switch protein FliG n=1 Tax=Periweissella beninensis TaxID=504936 RepID=A0ABT0VGH0_9LACO|nr:flagellar motor switch protein FliG [Periweissella beninensis]MBM7544694.1 flagellar motor switch protein FliG [Periweissella beninensis]MCM2436932.1 flagellar motor switch protein FliG [Periweissella beninensis]MCT4396319.1 flagellar motor switch protein FliG [Periweissella beninensis]